MAQVAIHAMLLKRRNKWIRIECVNVEVKKSQHLLAFFVEVLVKSTETLPRH